MTSPTWTPPPTMPADLPPLPVGRNGKPLVYLGEGPLNIGASPQASLDHQCQTKWLIEDNLTGNTSLHYAAESDSEVCRLNQWGDYTPKQPSEPCKDAQPPTLAAYLASIESAIKEADEAFKKAAELAAAWAKELQARRDIRDLLRGGNAEAWYRTGRIDGRAHAPMRKTFPLHP